jgi:hypothetical protein
MNYILLISGMVLVGIAIIMIIVDSFKKSPEIKNLELVNEQTGQLIEELNEISAIIVDEMDKKYNRMVNIYREFETITASKQQKQEPRVLKEETEKGSRKDIILKLYKEGMEPSQIASRLDMGIGEVELIIKIAGQGGNKNEKII